MKTHRFLFSPDATGGGTAVAEPPAAPAAPAAAPEAPAASSDPFADLDEAMKPTPPAPKPDPKAKTPDPKVKDAPKVDPKVDPKAAAKPDDKPKDEPTDTDGDGRKFTTPKALRDAHERATKELKEARGSIKAMEDKIKAAEESGKNTEKLNKRLADLEKERDEAKATVRLLKFEASDEYKNKYDKPFKRAATRAEAMIKDLQVSDGEDADGNPKVRAATWDDFSQLYSMPKGKAIQLAHSMFGNAAPVVLQELLSLQKMDLDRTDALAEEKTQWQSREAEEKVNQEKKAREQNEQNEQARELWVKLNTDIAEKNPEFFMADPKDKQAAEIFEKSLALVDSRHNGESLTLSQRVMLDAQVRLRAAGFAVAQYRMQKLQTELAEAKATIEEMKGSKPGDVQRGGGIPAAPKEEDSFEGALKSADFGGH